MTDYVSSALFIYTQDTESLCEQVKTNPFDTNVTAVAFDTLLRNPQKWLAGAEHVVVSGHLNVIKKIMSFAMDYHFSIGLIPEPEQKP